MIEFDYTDLAKKVVANIAHSAIFFGFTHYKKMEILNNGLSEDRSTCRW